MKSFLRFLVFFSTLLGVHAAWAFATTPHVIVSIKPLHSLVAQVMGDVATPVLLVDGTTSPHEFQMKPSHMSKLQHADLVFYLDGGYEKFLHHALQSLPKSVQPIALIHTSAITLLPIRGAGPFEKHSHAPEHHRHSDKDYHVWLNPVYAQAMVRSIASALIKRYPQHQKIFAQNAARTLDELQTLDATLAKKLKPFAGRSFIIFHDATQYFEQRYGLHASGSITLEPNESASWYRIESIRKKIAASNTHCIFTEPYFSDKQLRPIVSDVKQPIHRGVLDPEGTALNAGATLYKALMKGMVTSFINCLVAA